MLLIRQTERVNLSVRLPLFDGNLQNLLVYCQLNISILVFLAVRCREQNDVNSLSYRIY